MLSRLGFALLFLLAPHTVLVKSVKGQSSFNYADPNKWKDEFPTCGGKRQSPINIEFENYDWIVFPPVILSGYKKQPKTMNIINNGHTVQVTASWPRGETPMVSGGPLNGSYVFAQLHFHWGPTNYVGSEHTLEGKSDASEMHLVHWKKEYGSLSKATEHDDGLAVIASVLSTFVRGYSRGFENMETGLRNVVKSGQQIGMKPFPLSDFGINTKAGFTTYKGSLTTPPCTESVTWLISGQKNTITNRHVIIAQILGLKII